MGFSTLVCSYIYGTFETIVGALESYIKLAKGTLNRIESLSQAAWTFWKYTVEKAVETIINLIKTYEKKLVDMIWDPSSEDALGHSIWCSRLWDCLTFVNELLDPNSLLFKQLDKWFKKQCTPFVNKDLLNNIRSLLTDFQTFQQTVCAYGFTFEFGLAMIKQVLNNYKKQLLSYFDTIQTKISSIKRSCNIYLDWTIDTGIVDYLTKIEGLFNCVIDSNETCASIATASNYFNNACAKLHIQKSGDTWSMDPAYLNELYGGLEGAAISVSNAKLEIDAICDIIVNPKEVKRANKAYNLSKNVFPGGLKWSDVTTDSGNLSLTKLTSGKTWEKHTLVKKYNQTKDALLDAWNRNNENKITTETLADGTEIDENGNIYITVGCALKKIEPPVLPTEIVEEVYLGESGSNEILIDGDEVKSVTQAAVDIAKNPNSTLAHRCEKIWRTLNDWSHNDDIVKKYNVVKI